MASVSITTIVGARPQFVKAAALGRALKAADVSETLIHTGQHFEHAMSGAFFEELGLDPPAVNLGIASLSHGAMTGRMMEALEARLTDHRPDAVLVFGDTNSTLAGALTAAKLDIPVIHCEAGLRSGRRSMPEEINRIVADHVSALLLAPSRQAEANLAREGLAARTAFVGDVMFDVTRYAGARSKDASAILERLKLAPGGYDVLTLHRAENVDEPARLATLIDYVEGAGARPAVFPVHPRTAAALQERSGPQSRLILCEPLGYFDFHRLLSECAMVMTDSGGVQKEAYFHRKPCVTLRDETEWTETIDAGWNRLWTTPTYREPRRDIDDYGDGHAAERAVTEIEKLLVAR